MKLDILKTSLLAMVFAVSCTTAMSSSSSDTSSDDSSHKASRTSHGRSSVCDTLSGIEDKTCDRGPAKPRFKDQQRAEAYLRLFNSCDPAKKLSAVRNLYKMLRVECEGTKLAAGWALIQILGQANPQRPSDSGDSDVVKAFSLNSKLHMDSCDFAKFVERLVCTLSKYYVDQAKAAAAAPGAHAGHIASTLEKTLTSMSNASFYVNLLGKSGVKLALGGEFGFDVLFDPCGNPCPPCQPKPCKPAPRPCDKGTRQVVDHIILAFGSSKVTRPVEKLLSQVLLFGTADQQKIIRRLLGRHER